MTALPSVVASKLPRVVEVIRVSTQDQVEKNTPENQRRQLDALNKSRPGNVVARLEALGVSGAKDIKARTDLQELARLSAAKAFDEIRVVSIDRLTRSADPRERMMVFGLAMDAGAVIVDAGNRVIDPGDQGGLGEIDFYLQTLFAARERQKIIARTGAGRKRAAQDGQLSQGSPPYGRKFNHETKAWELVPDEVKTYRRIVAETLQGHSTRDIAKRLNADGTTPARVTKWGHSTIKRLLRSETIIGRYTVLGHLTQIPPILTAAEWSEVRTAMKTRSHKADSVAARPAMLRGILICGSCGLRASVIADGAGEVHRYGCPKPSGRPQGAGPCPDRKTVRAPDLDSAVRSMLLSIVSDSAALKKAIEAQSKTGPTSSAPTDAASATKEIEKLDAALNRTLRLMDDGLLPEKTARERLAEIRDKRAEAEALKERATVAEAQPTTPKDLKVATDEMAKALKAASPARMTELLRILVPAEAPYGVTLSRKGVEIVGRLPVSGRTRQMATASAHSSHLPGVAFRVKLLLSELPKPPPQKRGNGGQFL